MKKGQRRIDPRFKDLIKIITANGKWTRKDCSKHTQFKLTGTDAIVTVAGSSSDPARAVKNFICDVNRAEKANNVPLSFPRD